VQTLPKALPRRDESEVIEPGDVVGIVEGKVTRTTIRAHAVSVVTSNPVVVGNSPGKEKERLYTRVAFVGQTPVKVRGHVSAGDLIVPSGLGDGVGVVAPAHLTPQLAAQVIGQAWTAKPHPEVGLVTVAVNLNAASLAARLAVANSQ